MKTSKRKPANAGIATIKKYLKGNGIAFTRNGRDAVDIPAYGNQQNQVVMSLGYEETISSLTILVSGGIATDVAHLNDVLRYLNHVNCLLDMGKFYACPCCLKVHYRISHALEPFELSDNMLDSLLQEAFTMYVDYVLPVNGILAGSATTAGASVGTAGQSDKDVSKDGGAQ